MYSTDMGANMYGHADDAGKGASAVVSHHMHDLQLDRSRVFALQDLPVSRTNRALEPYWLPARPAQTHVH
jgi:hypothetical protein